ncbi:hypothetical protein [Aureivirga sp. CE67]|uniref:hypothetical protein n=1 Tax=Aureivirga sp. CE67 TaxID=1788983 RepID=UPI0018C97D03|nr:hypothetical protein [Aureivirga sp. CE67]
MKKYFLTLLVCLIASVANSQESGNYFLVVDNDTIPVSLGEEFKFKPKRGKEVSMKLIQPNELTFSDSMISFKYPKNGSVSVTDIGSGIQQLMFATATGTGYMVQEYTTMDPSSLVRFMLMEITKESLNYGYTKTEKPFKKELADGTIIEGIEAVMEYRGEVETFIVASYGKNNSGLMIMTMQMNEGEKEREVIDLFLNTLKIKI